MLGQRYGVTPAAQLGLEAEAQRLEALGDTDDARRARLRTYWVNEAAALATLLQPDEPTTTTTKPRATTGRAEGMVAGRDGSFIRGRAKVDEASAPPEIDLAFPSVTLEELAQQLRAAQAA